MAEPRSLYLYCPINNDERRTWLERILVGCEIYFRSRVQLNDPNELRPSIVFEGTDKQLRVFIRQLLLTRSPIRLSPANRLLEENRLMYRYRTAPEGVQEMLHDTLDRVGLLCLSETSTHHLLWAHYADGHRGVCVEFDPNVGLFQTAQKVRYTDRAPRVNRLVDNPDVILEKSMFTKGQIWSYEEEWRVIARWDDQRRIERYLALHDEPPDVRLFIENQHGPGYYSFPVGAVRSVILGSRLQGDAEDWLGTVIPRAPAAITVRRATLTWEGASTVG